MATYRKNLYVDQGVDFTDIIDLSEVAGITSDVSNNDFYCYVKKLYSSPITFQCSVTINLQDSNKIDLSISSITTENIEPNKYQYDIIMKDGSSTTKIQEGLLFLLPTVTIVD